MAQPLDDLAFDTLFRNARTHNTFQDKPVTDEQLQQLYNLMKWGPTAMNALPARMVFLKSKEAKEKLKPALSPGNLEKTLVAPVTAIIAYDLRFFDHLPTLFPAYDARPTYEADPELAKTAAFRNGTLQGGYLILAARALGLDVGPMSGFDNKKVDAAFFPDGQYKSNFLANIGYGDDSGLYPRGPRLEFTQACSIL
ncbi:MAG: malonic semialdehyde reductase [Sedimenticola sp.]|jgi:nitroreductase|nr:MAG: malonic semialdehyde reductase [Sedimenticola sp.]